MYISSYIVGRELDSRLLDAESLKVSLYFTSMSPVQGSGLLQTEKRQEI